MDRLKERWEFIVGYLALIVSLSAFKDELSEISINIGIYNFNAASYFFFLILGYLFTLHLFLIPFAFSSTKYANLKLFSSIESFSYWFFIILTLSPLIILIMVGIVKLDNLFKPVTEENKWFTKAIVAIVGALAGMLSSYLSDKFRSQKYNNKKQELENEEIIGLEKAQKLFRDEYYSQTILETFKALELHLRRLLAQRKFIFRGNSFLNLMEIAVRYELISEKEINKIKDLQKMRNSAAHIDVEYTKKEAMDALNYVKDLIRKTSPDELIQDQR